MKQRWQVSIRELMLLVSIVALGFSGLMTGGWLAVAAMLLALALAVGFAVIAFVGHGRLRTFSIGFLVAWVFYVAVHVFFGLSSSFAKPPTGQLIEELYERGVGREYKDMSTGQTIAPPTAGSTQRYVVERAVDWGTFMSLAHFLLAAGTAYAGGRVAVWVSPEPNHGKNETINRDS